MFAWLLLPVLLSPRLAEPPPVAERTVRVEFQSAESTQMGDGPVQLVSTTRTLDVMVGPDGRFRGRVAWDKVTITVKGKLTLQPDGRVLIDIDAVQSTKTGDFIPIADGEPDREIENKLSAKTQLEVKLNETILIGGFESTGTQETSEGITHRLSKQRVQLTILNEPTE